MNRPDGKDVFPWHEWLPHTCEFSLEETSRHYFAVKSVLHLDDKDKPNLFVTCRFHRKVPIYAAGESVSGTVYAFVDDPFPCKSVNIHLRGVCFIDLPPSHPKGSKCIEVLHVDVFNSWTAEAPDDGSIHSGISKFKFSLQIPENARATTLDSCVSVLYCILVEFVPPDNHEYKKIMAFGGYVKIRSHPYIEERILHGQKSCTEVLEVFGKDGALKGKLHVEVQLPAQGAVFNTGQRVNIDVTITQQYFSGCYKLEEIFPVLVQNIVFQSDPSVEFSRVFSPCDQCRNVTLRKKLRALTYKFTLSIGDIMPSTQPSIARDDLLSISYHLQLLVKHEFKDTYYSLCSRPVAVVDDLNICTDMEGNYSYLSLQADDDVSSEEESEPLMNAFDACYVSGKYGPEEDEIPKYYASVRQLLTASSEFMVDFISKYSFMDLVDKKQPTWRKSPRARVEAEREAEEFKKAVEKARKVNDFVEMGVKSTLRVMTKWKCRKYVTRQDSKEFRLFLKQNVLKIIEFKKWILSEIATYSPLVGNSSEHFPCTGCRHNGLETETSKDLTLSAPKKGERASMGLRKSRLISKISKKDIVPPSLTPSNCGQTLNDLVRYIWFDEKETPTSSNNTSPSSSVPFAVISIFPSTIKSDLSHGVLFKYPTGLKRHSSSSDTVGATANGSVTEDDTPGPPTEAPTDLARSSPCENICAPSGLVALNVIDNKIIRKIYMTQHVWNVIRSNAFINFTIAHSNISGELTNPTFTSDELVRQKKHIKKPPEKTDRNLTQKTQIKGASKSETMGKYRKAVSPACKNAVRPEDNANGKAKQEPITSTRSAVACTLDGIVGSYCPHGGDECRTTAHVDTCQSNSQDSDCKRAFHKNNYLPISKEESCEAHESDSISSDTGSIDELDTTTYNYFTWSKDIARDNKICGAKSSDSELSDSQKVSLDCDLNVSRKKLAKNTVEATLSAKHVDERTEIRDNAAMKVKNTKVSSTNTKSRFGPLSGVKSHDHKPTNGKTCKIKQEMKSGHVNGVLFSVHLTSQDNDASDESTTESSFFSSGSQMCRRIYSDSWSIPSITVSESEGKSPNSCYPPSSVNETSEKKQLTTENDTQNHTKTNIENDTETNTASAKTKFTTSRDQENPVGQRSMQLKTNSADKGDKKEKVKISDRFLTMQSRSGKQLAKGKRKTKALEHEAIETVEDVKSDRILKKENTMHKVENAQNSRSDISQDMHTKVDLSMFRKYSTKIFFEGPTSDGKLPKLAVVTRAKPRLPEDEHGVREPSVIRPETGKKRSPRSMQTSPRLECNFREASLGKLAEVSTRENKAAEPNSLCRVQLEESTNSTDSQNMEVNPDRTTEEIDPNVDNQSNDFPDAVSSCANTQSSGRLASQSGTCTVLEIWHEEVEKMFDQLSSDSPPISYAVPRTVDSEGPFRVTRFEKDHEKLWEVNVIGNMELQHTGIWSHKPLNTWATMKYGDAATVFSIPNFERHRVWRSGPLRSKLNPRAPSFACLISANQKVQKLPSFAQPNIILSNGDNTHPDDTNPISDNTHPDHTNPISDNTHPDDTNPISDNTHPDDTNPISDNTHPDDTNPISANDHAYPRS